MNKGKIKSNEYKAGKKYGETFFIYFNNKANNQLNSLEKNNIYFDFKLTSTVVFDLYLMLLHCFRVFTFI